MKFFSKRNRKSLFAKLSQLVVVMVLVLSILDSMPRASAEKIIGIDLGTKQSAFAISVDGKTTIIPNEQGNRLTPSIVAFSGDEILVGDAAYNQMVRNPTNTIFDAKRFIGRTFDDPTVQQDLKLLPFDVVNKNNKPHFQVEFKGTTQLFSAEQISALVLQKLKQRAEAFLGEPIEKAVITVPAYFDDTQKQSTKDAGTIAGLDVVRIINEPTSAAIAYGIDRRSSDERHIIIYDLGGGTFDVSLLATEEGVFEVVATGGDSHLGGEDFDENVVRFMMRRFQKKHGLDISSDDRALSKLRRECEKAKRALSSTTQTKIEIENLMDGVDFSEMLTRARFEALNEQLFRETLKPLQQILTDGKLRKSDVDEVILVGGSTRIPKIQQMVQSFFDGKSLNRGVNPDEAVAEGASIQAAIMGDHYGAKGDDMIVMDATPLSLGIETVGGIMTKVIPRGTNYPISKAQVFSTHSDNQDSVLIRIFQGERAETDKNTFLGKFMLSGIPPQPRGVPQIEVRFEIDANGLLQVEAHDKAGGNREALTITREDHHAMSQEEIDRIVADFEQFAADDELLVQRTAAMNRFESSVFGAKSKLYDKKHEMEQADFEQLEEFVSEMIDWLDENRDSAEHDDFVEKQHEFDEVIGQIFAAHDGARGDDDRDDHFDHEEL